jgi:hypothetical protein
MFKAVNQTAACRTPKLGTRIYKCPECEKKKVVYHSCKNRFCPRCGYTETQKWNERLFSILAPIRHHHVVFTLPEGLLSLAHRYPKVVYNALFSSASFIIKEWFQNKHKLTPGIVAVLHTAGFALKRHIRGEMPELSEIELKTLFKREFTNRKKLFATSDFTSIDHHFQSNRFKKLITVM